ncbi:hypothetical protein LTR12_010708 [Friedmanniomyces endolithicus]|nr:hypothetical protein LTR74_006736 [Friedmanniomyces endolithicus]KAK1814932.1 hypothetical protein LTR12_010708 [Friedmanniomyces endolithicus]
MPSDLWSEKDEDDYGIPVSRNGRGATSSPLWSLRRLRTYAPWIACLLLFVLFLTGSLKTPSSLKRTNWSRFAYVQYATDDHNLCNAVMMFEALHRYGSKAERVLLHNPQWTTTGNGGKDRNAQLLTLAVKKYGVTLKPVRLLDERGEMTGGPYGDGAHSSWDTSITKLRAFELTEYERVLHLDSDMTLFDHLDELFLLPKTPVAMPRAYWTDEPPGQRPLTSLLILLEPNAAEMRGMLSTLRSWWVGSEQQRTHTHAYDMELLNHRFGSSALVLPHRPYALLSGEFRSHDHSAYLGTINAPAELKAKWDPDAVLKEAKLVHFSDSPLPKPWIMWPYDGLAEIQPNCTSLHETSTCRERDIWKGLYDDFRRRRKDICRLLSVAAPEWKRYKQEVGAA